MTDIDGFPRPGAPGWRSRTMTNLRFRPALLILVLSLMWVRRAEAWIYPEHRDIASRAIAKLPAPARARLEQLWAESRVGYPAVLCKEMAAGDQGLSPVCVDFAAWPALAGD